MKTHDLTKLSHHVWETQSRVNIYSPRAVEVFDRLVHGSDTVIVTRINKAEDSARKGIMFYEVDVKPV